MKRALAALLVLFLLEGIAKCDDAALAEALVVGGAKLLAIGKTELAEANFYRALAYNPQCGAAYLELAIISESRKDFGLAADLYRRARPMVGGEKERIQCYKRIAFLDGGREVMDVAIKEWKRSREAILDRIANKIQVVPPLPESTDLLKIFDPRRDSISGTWSRNSDGSILCTANSNWARVEFPFTPPKEYDLTVRFCHKSGGEFVALIASHDNQDFAFIMGWGGNTVARIDQASGSRIDQSKLTLALGRDYTAVLRVRNSGVTAMLDGKVICASRYTNISLRPQLSLRTPMSIGLSVHDGNAVFYSASIVEIK